MTPPLSDGVAAPAAPARSLARVKRIAIRTGIALGAATLAIGALHMPFARGLLMRAGGCPMAGVKMTPKEMDSARRMALATNHAVESAPARPALGFALDGTTLEDVHAWAKRSKVDCEDVHAGLVSCTNVPPKALGRADVEKPVDELALGFDTRGRLVNVTTLRTHLRPDDAARTAQDIVVSLASSLGVAREVGGDFGARPLSRPGAASIATRGYRFRDYVADVTAMNFPAEGLALREHYMSAND